MSFLNYVFDCYKIQYDFTFKSYQNRLFNNFTVLWKESPYNIVFICRAFPFRNQYYVSALVSNMARGQQEIFHSCFCAVSLKSDSEVAQSCLTLSNPMVCSLPGSPIHGIFQARVPEWGAIAFSDGNCYYILNNTF